MNYHREELRLLQKQQRPLIHRVSGHSLRASSARAYAAEQVTLQAAALELLQISRRESHRYWVNSQFVLDKISKPFVH